VARLTRAYSQAQAQGAAWQVIGRGDNEKYRKVLQSHEFVKYCIGNTLASTTASLLGILETTDFAAGHTFDFFLGEIPQLTSLLLVLLN